MNPARAWTRLQNLIAFGTTAAAMNDGDATPTVQATLTELETQPALQVVHHFGFSSSPPIGSRILALFGGGDRSKGVAIGTIDPAGRRRNLLPGEVQMGPGPTMEIHIAGDVITIRHPTKVRIEAPKLECTGEVTAMCDSAPVGLSTHQSTNVQPGSGTSGPPKSNT